MHVLNPDDYLETSGERVYSPERNARAWEALYSDLDGLLRSAPAETRLFVVMGVQGGGKTTWVRRNRTVLESAIVLDAAVPAKRHRARAIAAAQSAGVQVVGVWVKTSLELALSRNAGRRADEVVPEDAVRSVFGLLEAPSHDEGFDEVIIVDGGAGDA